MKYFKNVNNLEELRREYKKLLKKYHPDQPEGSEEATKEINTEYDLLFATLKACKQQNNQEEKKDEFNAEFDKAFREILAKIIDLNVDIEVIGTWIWISGNTYAVKETLKRLGFRWISTRKSWAWHEEPYQKHHGKQKSMDELRNFYGSKVVKNSISYESLTAC